jgi:hypothetical protein
VEQFVSPRTPAIGEIQLLHFFAVVQSYDDDDDDDDDDDQWQATDHVATLI